MQMESYRPMQKKAVCCEEVTKIKDVPGIEFDVLSTSAKSDFPTDVDQNCSTA